MRRDRGHVWRSLPPLHGARDDQRSQADPADAGGRLSVTGGAPQEVVERAAAVWAGGMAVLWNVVAGTTIGFIAGLPVVSMPPAADEVLLVSGEHGISAFDLREPTDW